MGTRENALGKKYNLCRKAQEVFPNPRVNFSSISIEVIDFWFV